MDGLTSYLDMGGYAAFVWPAIGVAVFVLVAMAVTSMRRLRTNEATLRKLAAARAAATADGEAGP